jgi:uncharacterized membrane protein YdjX (TVP38/TMEM64 family)
MVLICAAVALFLSVDAGHAFLQRTLSAAEPLITGHPFLGVLAFVVLAAASAVLAFFSSALLLPVAVFTWGSTVTVLLLWLGWLLGGIGTFTLGRALRSPRRGWSRAPGRLDFYRQRVPGEVTFALVLLLCLALPSEIPGYLCGFVGVRLRTYLAALSVAELPYAVGAVLLAGNVVDRQVGELLALGLIGTALSAVALWVLHRRLEQPT